MKSPLCPKCGEKKVISQSYKIAGKPLFRCGTCKYIFPLSEVVKEQD